VNVSLVKSNQIKSNQIKSSQVESNQVGGQDSSVGTALDSQAKKY
jgi:hypothetical protein